EENTDAPEEECGIFGLYSEHDVDTFSLSQFGLFALQHRGQEACGISVAKNGKIFNIKDEGLVLDVFKDIENPENFMGNSVIGHTRYTTAGDKKKYNFQPFFAKNEYDQIILSIAHNGNLTNAKQLKKELEEEGVVFKATSDSEVILRLIQKNLDLGLRGAIKETMEKIQGAYSVVGITRNKFFAFRDFHGIRPLVLGMMDDKTCTVADESAALDGIAAKYVRDIKPGEIVYTSDHEKGLQSFMVKENCERRICSFEYIYFARPDSQMENINVYDIREKSGEKIWEQAPVDADIVIGVPDSGVPAAIGFSRASGIPFRPVLVKNRYIRSENCERRICSFEYIYFARPDSQMENINVYDIREKSGEKIWEQAPVDADIVIGVPDSGVPAAIGFSRASGIPFRPVLVKNRYI